MPFHLLQVIVEILILRWKLAFLQTKLNSLLIIPSFKTMNCLVLGLTFFSLLFQHNLFIDHINIIPNTSLMNSVQKE